MRQLENTLKIKDSSFIYTPEGMYFSERLAYNLLDQIPIPEVIYQNDKYTIYGAGPLIKNNH